MSKGSPTRNIRWPEKDLERVKKHMETHKIGDFGVAVRDMVEKCATLEGVEKSPAERRGTPFSDQSVPHFDPDVMQQIIEEAWDSGGFIVVTRLMKAHQAQIQEWEKSQRIINRW